MGSVLVIEDERGILGLIEAVLTRFGHRVETALDGQEGIRKYDRGNLLLAQADREVLEQELELARLRSALARMRAMRPLYRHLQQPTPFAFPLLVERLREQVSTEQLADRIARMVAELERRAAGDGA